MVVFSSTIQYISIFYYIYLICWNSSLFSYWSATNCNSMYCMSIPILLDTNNALSLCCLSSFIRMQNLELMSENRLVFLDSCGCSHSLLSASGAACFFLIRFVEDTRVLYGDVEPARDLVYLHAKAEKSSDPLSYANIQNLIFPVPLYYGEILENIHTVSNTTFALAPVCSPMFWWEPRLIVGDTVYSILTDWILFGDWGPSLILYVLKINWSIMDHNTAVDLQLICTILHLWWRKNAYKMT